MIPSEFDLPVGDRGVVHGDVRVPSEGRPRGVVVLAMGLLKFKDWGFYPYLCERMAERGYATVCFNPALSGVLNNREGVIVDPDGATRATLRQELGDLLQVLNAVKTRALPGLEEVDVTRLALMGHSQGSGLGVLAAARERSVRAVLCFSPVATFHRFSPAEVERVARDGYMEVKLEGRAARLTKAYLDDLHEGRSDLDLEAALRDLHVPMLLIHGEENHIIDVTEAERVYHWSDKDRSKLVLLEKTGHTFGAGHPFGGSNGDLDRAIEIAGNFLDQTLELP